MAMNDAHRAAQVAASVGNLSERTAGAANPSRSMLGRISDAAAAVTLARRVLPTAWRLLRRYPLLFTLGAAATLSAVYFNRSSRTPSR